MEKNQQDTINKPTRYSFGSTSAVIVNLALITGLITSTHAKVSIIGSLLVSAIADNISDALGIHIYQESEGHKPHQVWLSTMTNFAIRLVISLGFVFIMIIFPLNLAVIISLVYGLSILSTVSYIIAIKRKTNPWHSIFEHLIIAASVIILSNFVGRYIFKIIK